MSEFEVQSGKHMLVLSSSQFDRIQTCAGADRKVLLRPLQRMGQFRRPLIHPAGPLRPATVDKRAKTGVHLSSYLTAPPVMPLMKRSKKRL